MDPDQIRLTLCYTNYRSLNCGCSESEGLDLLEIPHVKVKLRAHLKLSLQMTLQLSFYWACRPFTRGCAPWPPLLLGLRPNRLYLGGISFHFLPRFYFSYSTGEISPGWGNFPYTAGPRGCFSTLLGSSCENSFYL